MRVYLGQTRSRALIDELAALGFGEMVSRGELPARRKPWAYDNVCYADWKAGRPFDAHAFVRDIDDIAGFEDGAVREVAGVPDFIVLPDIVAGGEASLERSVAWLPDLLGVAPLYLAVQDGMTQAAVEDILEDAAIDGLFVGGSLRWKLRMAAQWIDFGHKFSLKVHLGRFGTPERAEAALRMGADSIDSCLPLWSKDKLQSFVAALADSSQMKLI